MTADQLPTMAATCQQQQPQANAERPKGRGNKRWRPQGPRRAIWRRKSTGNERRLSLLLFARVRQTRTGTQIGELKKIPVRSRTRATCPGGGFERLPPWGAKSGSSNSLWRWPDIHAPVSVQLADSSQLVRSGPDRLWRPRAHAPHSCTPCLAAAARRAAAARPGLSAAAAGTL